MKKNILIAISGIVFFAVMGLLNVEIQTVNEDKINIGLSEANATLNYKMNEAGICKVCEPSSLDDCNVSDQCCWNQEPYCIKLK